MARWTDLLRMRVKTPISTYLQPLNAFRMDGVLVFYRSAVGSERQTKGTIGDAVSAEKSFKSDEKIAFEVRIASLRNKKRWIWRNSVTKKKTRKSDKKA